MTYMVTGFYNNIIMNRGDKAIALPMSFLHKNTLNNTPCTAESRKLNVKKKI